MNPKKKSSEDRSKKKKSKSSKRVRDSSLSSYSSSDSDESLRPRKKYAQRDSKKSRRPPSRGDAKKKKESKKSGMKRSKKVKSRRSVSSISSRSNGSCSTSRSSRSLSSRRSHSYRSRSPVRKSRLSGLERGRGRSRGREIERKSSRKKNYDRGRRWRRSCSTCSGYVSYSGSSSPGRSPSREKYRGRDSLRSHSRTRRERSKRTKSEDKAKIIKAYDDFPASKSNDSDHLEEKRKEDKTLSDSNHIETLRKITTDVVDGMQQDGREVSVKNKIVDENQELFSNCSCQNDKAGVIGACQEHLKKDAAAGKKIEVAANSSDLEANKLELILRMKALQNFNKYLGGKIIPAAPGRKDDAVATDSCKDTGRQIEAIEAHKGAKSVTLGRNKTENPIECSISKDASLAPHQSRLASVVITREKNEESTRDHSGDDNAANQVINLGNYNNNSNKLGSINDQKASDLPSTTVSNQETGFGSSSKQDTPSVPESVPMFSEKTLLGENIQENNASQASANRSVYGVPVSATGNSLDFKIDNPNCSSNEPTDGSQFEKKHFLEFMMEKWCRLATRCTYQRTVQPWLGESCQGTQILNHFLSR